MAGERTRPARDGSSTVAPARGGSPAGEAPVLRVRGAPGAEGVAGAHPAPEEQQADGRHVRWAPETVDNEHLGRKKSNVCCIFHPAECPAGAHPPGWNAYEP